MQQQAQQRSSFGPAFLVLKRSQRAALAAFYTYARTIDDIADDPQLPENDKRMALTEWGKKVEAVFSAAAPLTGPEAGLARAAGEFKLSKKNFLLLLEGVGLDISKHEYTSFEELKYYMYRVASAVGLTCLEIFGWRGPAAELYAENLGYAVQLTNIIRDVFEDAKLGRIYLPAEDLKRFNCDAVMLKNYVYPPNFIELMEFEAGRAREFYRIARNCAAKAERKKLLSAFIMARLYEALLDKIIARRFKTAGSRIRLNFFEKIQAIFRAWTDTK